MGLIVSHISGAAGLYATSSTVVKGVNARSALVAVTGAVGFTARHNTAIGANWPGDDTFFFGRHDLVRLETRQDAIGGHFEVLVGDGVGRSTRGNYGRFITYVLDLGAREAGRQAGQSTGELLGGPVQVQTLQMH